MASSSVEDCFQEAIEEGIDRDSGENRFELGEVDVGELSFTPPEEVDQAAAWQVMIPVEITEGAGEGLSPSVYVEFVILREGDSADVLQTEDVLTQFDPRATDRARASGGRADDQFVHYSVKRGHHARFRRTWPGRACPRSPSCRSVDCAGRIALDA